MGKAKQKFIGDEFDGRMLALGARGTGSNSQVPDWMERVNRLPNVASLPILRDIREYQDRINQPHVLLIERDKTLCELPTSYYDLTFYGTVYNEDVDGLEKFGQLRSDIEATACKPVISQIKPLELKVAHVSLIYPSPYESKLSKFLRGDDDPYFLITYLILNDPVLRLRPQSSQEVGLPRCYGDVKFPTLNNLGYNFEFKCVG